MVLTNQPGYGSGIHESKSEDEKGKATKRAVKAFTSAIDQHFVTCQKSKKEGRKYTSGLTCPLPEHLYWQLYKSPQSAVCCLWPAVRRLWSDLYLIFVDGGGALELKKCRILIFVPVQTWFSVLGNLADVWEFWYTKVVRSPATEAGPTVPCTSNLWSLKCISF